MDPEQQLREACQACVRCPLAAGRHQAVVSRGQSGARLMLIGEAPGAEEDASGLPFVGRSGRLLDQLLAEAGIDSNREAYICNVIKCRPPGNRRPTAAELAACRPWLDRQLERVDPALVVLAGATAVEALLGIRGGLSRMRGQWQSWQGRWLMPVFHPSYLLRFPSTEPGSPRWHTASDFLAIRRRLDRPEGPDSGLEQPLPPRL